MDLNTQIEQQFDMWCTIKNYTAIIPELTRRGIYIPESVYTLVSNLNLSVNVMSVFQSSADFSVVHGTLFHISQLLCGQKLVHLDMLWSLSLFLSISWLMVHIQLSRVYKRENAWRVGVDVLPCSQNTSGTTIPLKEREAIERLLLSRLEAAPLLSGPRSSRQIN